MHGPRLIERQHGERDGDDPMPHVGLGGGGEKMFMSHDFVMARSIM